MKNIVTQLDAKKDTVMYFADGKTITFGDALKKLGEVIGKPQASTEEIIETIATAVKNRADQLMEGKNQDSETAQVLAGFFVWIRSIHNDQLAPPPGAQYPNNIVYTMLTTLRNQPEPTAEETLLKFFLDGANARKISKGETPVLDFIATAAMVGAIEATGKKTGNAESFQNNFNNPSYVPVQAALEKEVTELKQKVPFYAALDNAKVLEFKKTRNEETGANAYDLDAAIAKGKELLASDADLKQKASTNNSYDDYLITRFLGRFQKADLPPQAQAVALWDASEWISKVYVASTITGDSGLEVYLGEGRTLRDIIDRSRTGNFPANERNAALANVELVELFRQDALANSRTVAAVKEKFQLIPAAKEAALTV